MKPCFAPDRTFQYCWTGPLSRLLMEKDKYNQAKGMPIIWNMAVR